jgi:hypothetical protein
MFRLVSYGCMGESLQFNDMSRIHLPVRRWTFSLLQRCTSVRHLDMGALQNFVRDQLEKAQA